jgi:hypothetical protein
MIDLLLTHTGNNECFLEVAALGRLPNPFNARESSKSMTASRLGLVEE